MSVHPAAANSSLPYLARQSKTTPPPAINETGSPASQARFVFSREDPVELSRLAQLSPTERLFERNLRFVYDPDAAKSVPEDKKFTPAYGAFSEGENGELIWHSSRKTYDQYGGLAGIHEYYTDANGKIDSGVQETLSSIRDVVSEKKALKTLINRLAKKEGISSGDITKLKIDIGEDGKVLVGGLENTTLTKALQKTLNDEEGFAARLKAYQSTEKGLYNALENSMFTYTEEGEIVQGMDSLEMRVKAEGIDSIDNLGASPLTYAYLEVFRDDTASADFSHKDKGLANPGANIHQKLGTLQWDIQQELDNINLQSRMASPNKEQAPADVVSMDNIKITLNENGEITIDGSFSQSGSLDAEARVRATQILQDELAGQTTNGGESDLLTGLRQLRLDHDEEFGEADAGFAKTGSVTFDGDTSETFIDAPGAELAIQDEMEAVVMQAVADETGVELKDGAIGVNEEGRIFVKDLPPTADSEKVRDFIDSVNALMEEENSVLSEEELRAENEDDPVRKTADALKELLDELASYEQRTVRYFPYS